jgi:hypothetical protein
MWVLAMTKAGADGQWHMYKLCDKAKIRDTETAHCGSIRSILVNRVKCGVILPFVLVHQVPADHDWLAGSIEEDFLELACKALIIEGDVGVAEGVVVDGGNKGKHSKFPLGQPVTDGIKPGFPW